MVDTLVAAILAMFYLKMADRAMVIQTTTILSSLRTSPFQMLMNALRLHWNKFKFAHTQLTA